MVIVAGEDCVVATSTTSVSRPAALRLCGDRLAGAARHQFEGELLNAAMILMIGAIGDAKEGQAQLRWAARLTAATTAAAGEVARWSPHWHCDSGVRNLSLAAGGRALRRGSKRKGSGNGSGSMGDSVRGRIVP